MQSAYLFEYICDEICFFQSKYYNTKQYEGIFPPMNYKEITDMRKVLILLMGLSFVVSACQKVPFTDRKQVKLLPESTMNSMSFTNYQQFLQENKLSTNQQQVALVKKVGNDIKNAAEKYYKSNGMEKKLASYRWEFNLVEDPTVNAWCMPGGKVVFYTGILPITKDADGLAVVMGHEVAHALAHHGNERMSQGLATQLGGTALSVALKDKPQQTQNMFMQAYGLGANVGMMLPFSRMHESEADEIGLILMAMAGYNPDAAPAFWERMKANSGGQAPPQFMSTHPSHSTRIQKLKASIPKAKAYAAKYKPGS